MDQLQEFMQVEEVDKDLVIEVDHHQLFPLVQAEDQVEVEEFMMYLMQVMQVDQEIHLPYHHHKVILEEHLVLHTQEQEVVEPVEQEQLEVVLVVMVNLEEQEHL